MICDFCLIYADWMSQCRTRELIAIKKIKFIYLHLYFDELLTLLSFISFHFVLVSTEWRSKTRLFCSFDGNKMIWMHEQFKFVKFAHETKKKCFLWKRNHILIKYDLHPCLLFCLRTMIENIKTTEKNNDNDNVLYQIMAFRHQQYNHNFHSLIICSIIYK